MKNNLKEIRIQAGLTQEQLADAMGTSKTYISQLENGTRNIDTIRQSTMQKLCSALNCTPEDLIVPLEFEYDEDGKLIIDSAWHDPHFPTGYVILIENSAFLLPMGRNYNNGETASKVMRPLKFYTKDKHTEKIRDYEYVFIPCVPRNGFDVKLGRAITEEELSLIRKKYNITDNDISGEFEDTKGKIYGKYAKSYTCVQVRVDASIAIGLESELVSMGIEAGNISPGRVNIRVGTAACVRRGFIKERPEN